MSDHRADDMDVTPDVETGNMDRLLDRLDELTSAQGAPVRILLVAGEAITAGEVVLLRAGASGGDGKVWRVHHSSDSAYPHGVAKDSASANAPIWVVIAGIALVLPESGVTATRGYNIRTSRYEIARAEQSEAFPASGAALGVWIENGTSNGAATRALIRMA